MRSLRHHLDGLPWAPPNCNVSRRRWFSRRPMENSDRSRFQLSAHPRFFRFGSPKGKPIRNFVDPVSHRSHTGAVQWLPAPESAEKNWSRRSRAVLRRSTPQLFAQLLARKAIEYGASGPPPKTRLHVEKKELVNLGFFLSPLIERTGCRDQHKSASIRELENVPTGSTPHAPVCGTALVHTLDTPKRDGLPQTACAGLRRTSCAAAVPDRKSHDTSSSESTVIGRALPMTDAPLFHRPRR